MLRFLKIDVANPVKFIKIKLYNQLYIYIYIYIYVISSQFSQENN